MKVSRALSRSPWASRLFLGGLLGAALSLPARTTLAQPVEGEQAAALRALREAERTLFRPVGVSGAATSRASWTASRAP